MLAITPRLQDDALVLDLDAEMVTPGERGAFHVSRVTSEVKSADGRLELLRAGPMLVATTAWRVEGEADVQARVRAAQLDPGDLPRRARARRRALEATCLGD